jgi:hypothetical protein
MIQKVQFEKTYTCDFDLTAKLLNDNSYGSKGTQFPHGMNRQMVSAQYVVIL